RERKGKRENSTNAGRNWLGIGLTDDQMTGGELVVRCLTAQGVRHVFGIPGALNAGLYDALARQEEIQHLLVRHELGAAWMADGRARGWSTSRRTCWPVRRRGPCRSTWSRNGPKPTGAPSSRAWRCSEPRSGRCCWQMTECCTREPGVSWASWPSGSAHPLS